MHCDAFDCPDRPSDSLARKLAFCNAWSVAHKGPLAQVALLSQPVRLFQLVAANRNILGASSSHQELYAGPYHDQARSTTERNGTISA